MGERINDIFLSRQRILWSWLAVLLFKLVLVYLFAQMSIAREPTRAIGTISFASGDDYSYTGAVDNYIEYGEYFFVNQLHDTVRMGRSPHYAAPYWLARQVTSRENAGDFVTVLNVLLDSSAIICFAIMLYVYCSRRKAVWTAALVLGGISSYVSNWTYITTPDSPAAALLMIGFFFAWRAFREDDLKRVTWYLFFSSIFFSWSIVLRPYLSVIVVVMAVIFLWNKRTVYKILPRLALVCSIPFLLVISPWVIRNYIHFGKITFFQQDMYAGYGYRPAELQIRRMINSMGDDGGTFWDPKAMASYFSPAVYKTSQFSYPAYLKNDTLLYNRIESLRNIYLDSYRARSKVKEEDTKAEAISIRDYYIRNYKLRFFLINPLKRTATFWGHSGSYYIPYTKDSTLFLKAFKVLQSILYYGVLLFGTLGLFLLSRKDKFAWILLLPLFVLTLFFPVVFAFMEPRYAMGFYYPGLIGLIYLLHRLSRRFTPATRLVSV